jgi:type I restriction enzyme S subunit
MNADRLLAHYEKIADAPDAIARLRRFILDLAVRGKLVPQDANDEPVAKRYLIQGKASNLPANWGVLNFGNFCDIEGGNQPPKSQFIDEPREGYVQLFQIRDLGERGVPTYIPITSARSLSKEGDILIGRYGASVGKVFWAQNGAYNVAMAKFIWPHDALIANFAFLLLKSDFLQEPLAKATRSAQAGFNKGDLAAIDFPLPPLAEQHRIVAKVDELMGLCDRLEAARAGREAVRDRLAAASLARLDAPDRETFQEDARFALDALPALTTRPDQIKRLRQTILNLAVRGKLVPQDPNDEPASELLKRIAKEKARLVKAGEIRKPKALPDVEEPPFDLPMNWRWTPIREVASDRGQEVPQSAFTYIDVTAIDKERGVVADPKVLEASEAPSWARKITRKGDVIYSCVRPYLLNVAVIETDFDPQPIASTAFAILDGHGLVMPRYIWIVLRSPFMVACVEENQRGQAYPAINDADFAVLPFPVPPLAEQHRIVAKVDALMALCDRLEASLAATAATRRRLLDALLAEALAPVDKAEMEAAE